jgi:hypothetical protein
VGTSLRLCTARSTWPASIASSISFRNGALAPDALQAPVEDLIAGGRDLVELDLVTAGGKEVLTCSACQRASREPRVPIRIFKAEIYLRGGTLSFISSR